ncbi:hypothetical protein H8356DRAFT_1286474 [Neocallimastix lanati (nom. inval.)]|jgi:hypothetical protein|uniref:Uncharacterized protein n=1 Tax=Neocallimastix californiae TaxID=1754190 RepID=A0A1Y2BGM9_9FUNG|nr:hypothetical protein H8356DRAFT_1286474 [Neocallimastix sp. JGI-2020a]ORY33647.1 hypothetical protein LY90DRAFT_673351 [Neocallimastix californiae]|eukprot:ORY33647.1 hypothetical protein LY90DRAFT_673351 [Neocallimastix californiae]
MQNTTSNTNSKSKSNTKNSNKDGGNIKGKNSSNKKENINNNKENIPSNSEKKNSKHNNKGRNNNDENGNNKNTKHSNNNNNSKNKGKTNNNDDANNHGKKGNSLSKKKSKQNMGLNKKNSFINNHKKSNNRKNSVNDIIIKAPQPTEVFDKSVNTICVSKLPTYVNGKMIDNGMDKFITLIKQSLNDLGKVKLIGVEPALALTISIILILEEQKVIRKPVILTKTMEDKNKNLKSGIITELFPSTNKAVSKLPK